MKKLKAALIMSTTLVLAACVTINVYFPAAAAERAAEQFVGDVLAEPRKDGSLFDPLRSPGRSAWLAAYRVIDFLVPSAEAQQAEIDINTPQINAIKARMAERQSQSLASLFDAGAIGFTADGLEHNEKGTPSAKHSDHQQQLQKRQQKLEQFAFGDDWAELAGDGEIALISFGSSSAAVAEASALLADQGVDTRSVSLRLLAPLQVESLSSALAGAARVIVVEQNHSAQLFQYLRGQMDFPQHLHSYAQAGPVPLNAQQIAQYVLEVSAQ